MPTAPRLALVAAASVAVLAAGCSSSSKAQAPLATVATPPVLSTAVSSRQSLEFRPLRLVIPASKTITPVGGSANPQSCESLVTARADQHVTSPSEMLYDRVRANCYLLGPALVTGADVDSATVVYDAPTRSWAVKVHFKSDAFLTKVAHPLVNMRVAVALAGFVQSVFTVKPAAAGTSAEIIGGFTQVGAANVAAAILGVAPANVQIEPPSG